MPSEQNISQEIEWFCEQKLISITKGIEHHLVHDSYPKKMAALLTS
jgi:hypothetical protein